MLLYGFIAGRGALSAGREDYFKAFCWLWNVKCLDSPNFAFYGNLGCPRETGIFFFLSKDWVVIENGGMRKDFCSVYYLKWTHGCLTV